MKVIIAGSREFINKDYLFEIMDNLHKKYSITEVVSGGAKGADRLGQDWAYCNDIPTKVMLADWAKFGRGAGPKRNSEMLAYADKLVAFWDGVSSGTGDIITKATRITKY